MESYTPLLMTLLGVVLGAMLTWLIGRAQWPRLLRRLKDAVIRREHVSLEEEFLMTHILAEKIEKPEISFAISPGGAMIAEWLSRR
ncbi:MAG: hypothetical protein ACYTF6_02005, partial [Planctomycetota bacterium]